MIFRLPEDQQRMWRLLNAIKDYRDKDGRRLSTAFHKLPTKEVRFSKLKQLLFIFFRKISKINFRNTPITTR